MQNSNSKLRFPGLWPFAPDPAPAGLYTFGAPAPDSPLLITGNSRHTLNYLRRILTPLGARALAIDTGGVDVYSALAAADFTLEEIGAGLDSIRSNGEELETEPKQALLPYPVWKTLSEPQEIAGWQIAPGPAGACDLPAFFVRSCQLTDEMKTLRFPLEDRLRLGLAHAELFVLVAAIPLLFFGLKVMVTGAVLGLASVIMLAVLWPWLPGKHGSLKSLVLVGAISLAGLATTAYLTDFSSLNLLPLAVCMALAGGWMGWLYTPVQAYTSFDPF